MITRHNLVEQFPQIDKKGLPKILQNDYSFVVENSDLYDDDDDIKLYIDTYINKLNEWLSKHEKQGKQGKQKPSGTNKPIQDARKIDLSDSIYVMSKQAKQADFHHVDSTKGKQTKSKVLIKTTEYETIKHEIQLALKEKPEMCFRILENGSDHILYEGKIANTTPKMKQPKEPKPKKEATPKIPKSKTAKVQQPKSQGKPIEKLPPDVAYIKRYASMHGKQKTHQQVLSLLHSLQKSITDRTINKTMPYAKEVDTIQGELIVCCEKMGDSALIEIDAKALSHYLAIVHSFEPMLSVTYLKQYIALNGKEGIKDKAKTLADRIRKAVDAERISKADKYAKQLQAAYVNLLAYTDKTLIISQAELNGLAGLDDVNGLGFIPPILAPIAAGIATNIIAQQLNRAIEHKGTVMSSTQLASMAFETLPLTGEYKELIGIPSKNFSAMIYGMPGSGKTTWCIKFAKYLAQHHGLKVLFATIEEGINHTAQEKLKRLQATHINLSIADYMPDNLAPYDVVFIDSINSFRYSTDDLRALQNRYPNMIFISIFQATKEGKFKGSQEYEHDVDVVIRAEDGNISTVGSKNRFGGGGSVRVW